MFINTLGKNNNEIVGSKHRCFRSISQCRPGNIPPIANRLLEDEIPSLNRHLGGFKPKFNVTKGVTLSIDHAPDSVTCEYAILEPSDDGHYRFNTVISITGSLTGTFDIPAIKLNGRYDVAVMNLRVLLKVTLDMGAGGLPKPTLTGFQLSVDKLKLSSPTSKAITALWPFVAGITGAPGSLAGYLNTELNQKVIDLAKKALDKIGGPKQPTNFIQSIFAAAGINL